MNALSSIFFFFFENYTFLSENVSENTMKQRENALYHLQIFSSLPSLFSKTVLLKVRISMGSYAKVKPNEKTECSLNIILFPCAVF